MRVATFFAVAILLAGCSFLVSVERVPFQYPDPDPYIKPTAEPTAAPTMTASPTPTQPASPVATPTPGIVAGQPVTLTIAANTDDAHQWHKGVELSAWPLWLGYWDRAPEHGAWRFVGVPLPQGAAIERATLRLRGTTGDGLGMAVEVRGVAADNQPAWVAGADLLALPTTVASSPLRDVRVNTWMEVDVTAQVREVVSRPGWQAGNALALLAISRETGNRNVAGGVVDYSMAPAQAAQLVIVPGVVPAAVAAAAPATFTWLELAGIVDNVGGRLIPGSYKCEGDGDALTFCRVNGDIPGGELCVWPGGWGACE